MEEIKEYLHLDVLTVTGKTLGENLEELRRNGYYEECYSYLEKKKVKKEDILKVPELEIYSESEASGVYIVGAKGGRQIFVTGHSEYDPLTLKGEYDRDVALGLPINIPKNYYPGDDPTKPPIVKWRGHANLLFINWLNYYVYQETPYNLDELENM